MNARLPDWLIRPIESALDGWRFAPSGPNRFLLEAVAGTAGLDLSLTFADPRRTHVGFVVHLWLMSNGLSKRFGPRHAVLPKAIGPEECHWFRDAVFISEAVTFKPGRWEARADDLQSIRSAVSVVARVSEELRRRSTDEGLVEAWLAEQDVWLTEARQAAYLAVLLREIGRVEESKEFERRVRTIATSGDREASHLVAALEGPVTL